MKTNTLLLIGAGAVALYFLTKPKAAGATPFVGPLPMPPVWQGPIYQPTIEEQLPNVIETGINAALHTIPIFNWGGL